MDTMNTYARQCSVTIQVTHAFRKEVFSEKKIVDRYRQIYKQV